MPVDIVIPQVGESITSGVLAAWRKGDGEYVQRDDVILDLETDKVTMEVRAPAAGRLRHLAREGEEVAIGAVVGRVEDVEAPEASEQGVPAAPPSLTQAGPAPAASAPATTPGAPARTPVRATPLARKLAEQYGVDLANVPPTGAGARVREQDVRQYVASQAMPPSQPSGAVAAAERNIAAVEARAAGAFPRGVVRERMSPLRQRIAQRLVEAQRTAAMLTTFNECDMSRVIALRQRYREEFEKRYGVGLGFMPFFVRAAANALRDMPMVNAFIVENEQGQMEIEKHEYCDIAVAVATPRGLIVPVIRNAERLSFAAIEQTIRDFAQRGREGKITLEELQGGTFTITNAGVFGSILGTPFLNPPQSAILGMYAIRNRPVEDPERPGQVVVRPMMYLALSYDHRLLDGEDAARFLVRIREQIEDPGRLLLDL